MAGKVQAGRNVARLKAAHGAIADMMAEAGMNCDGSPLEEGAGGEPVEPTDEDRQAALAALEAFLAPTDVVEAALVEAFVPLIERAVGADGTIPLKVIKPGWGSSGYYGASVLERDGPTAFPAGTKMFWNHPPPEKARARPERDLRDLAAVTTTPATWQEAGPDGPGLYAKAKVFDAYRPAVDDLAGDIGVSIRASGRAKAGEAEGRKGPIIEAITAGQSVDFVTTPGAGGRILQLFEAARGGQGPRKEDNPMQLTEAQVKKLQEDNQRLTEANADLQNQVKTLGQSVARQGEAIAYSRAKELAEANVPRTLPQPTRERLVKTLAAAPVMKDGQLDEAAFTTTVKEAAAAEATYLEALGVGKVRGMGGGTDGGGGDDPAKVVQESEKSLAESFAALGLDEKTAAIAAKGR